MASLKIEIPIDDATQWRPKEPHHVTRVKERLSVSPTKTPEDLAQALAAKNARTSLLQKLEIEAKVNRARRQSELAAENKARKVRLEAATVARAASKIEKASLAQDAKREEHSRKREAAAARRAALFEAVRAQRQARQAAREARGKELSELEDSAFATRQKKLQSTVERTAAQVKHALEVATSLKEKEKAEAAAAAARLAARLAAAEGRRQDVLSATIEGAASVTAAAEKVRLRHLHDEKAALEERKLRLSQTMAKALGRRANQIDTIVSRAAKENSRVADVVSDTRHLTMTVKPAMMRHALAARLQAAQVSRMTTLKTKAQPTSRERSSGATPDASPAGTPLGTPGDKEVAQIEAPWKDKKAADSTSAIETTTQMRAFAKAPAVIEISTDEFVRSRLKPPSSALLNRLAFRPRMLLATAAARQAAAKGRRETYRAVLAARASHCGTTRVAVVLGRRAALTEYVRSIFDLRAKRAAARAATFIKVRAAKATNMLARGTAAKLARSSARLGVLNGAIAKEEARLAASERRKASITRRIRSTDAQAFVVKVRRAAAAERLASRGDEFEKRVIDATARREASLSTLVARAALMSMRKDRMESALVRSMATAVKPKATKAAARKVMAKKAVAFATLKAQANKAENEGKEADKEQEAEQEKEKENNEPSAATAEAPTAAEPPTDFMLPLSSLLAAATDVDKRIESSTATAEAKQRLAHQALTHFALLELGQGFVAEGKVKASYETWKKLEARLLSVVAADDAALSEKVSTQRAAAVAKAAEISELLAKRSEELAAARREAMAKVVKVKASLDEAAAKAGLRGKNAKVKAAAQPKVASMGVETAAADEADGFVVIP